ncbi:MAG: YigZ family protein [Lactobacillales bacterium]|jgi:uncharacterized YigZ family protein|nr:YigZ family protein [Lactobacillales bacterium]
MVENQTNEYFSIAENGQSEIEIKKSRFICSMKRVNSEEEAKEFIAGLKKEHWKANHNCSAFIIGDKMDIQRSSDDGEPSGTAGVPMLEVLKKNELINVVAVVTRYFGGTKLGTGGLIRAYSTSVSTALQEIGIVRGTLQQEISVLIQYPQLGKVQNFLENSTKYTLKDTLYTEAVIVQVLVDETQVETFEQEITELLNGQVTFTRGNVCYHEQRINYSKKPV